MLLQQLQLGYYLRDPLNHLSNLLVFVLIAVMIVELLTAAVVYDSQFVVVVAESQEQVVGAEN